jgi:hypothetical protein
VGVARDEQHPIPAPSLEGAWISSSASSLFLLTAEMVPWSFCIGDGTNELARLARYNPRILRSIERRPVQLRES